jgi:hypothetical protein
VTKLYEDDAELYDIAFDWDISDEADWLVERLEATTVLEPGCGSGRMLEALADRGCVDATAAGELLARAHALVAFHPVPRKAGVSPLLFGTCRHEARTKRLGSDPCCSGRASMDRARLAAGSHDSVERHDPVEGEGDPNADDGPLLEAQLRAKRHTVVGQHAATVDVERRALCALA